MAPGSRNGNVTNKDLFAAITDLRLELKADIKDVKDDVNCVDGRIDELVKERGDLKAEIATVKTQTENLSKRVGAWDVGNSVGVLIAGILAYFGIKN